MNILFAGYGDFHTNSALHIFNIANRLQMCGHQCVVAVPGDPGSVRDIGIPLFQPVSMKQWLRGGVGRSGSGSVDLVVAWTPREVVRKFIRSACEKKKLPYVVHLEDNEHAIVATHAGVPIEKLFVFPRSFWDRCTPKNFAHPYRMRELLAGAAGVTALGDPLLEFVPPGCPSHVFRPGWNEESFTQQAFSNGMTREKLGVPEGACVIVYHGNSHSANASDMRSLYAAVAIANRAGTPVRLIRIGRDGVDFLGDLAGIVSPYVTTVGYLQDHRMVAAYLALADVCVQPGKADAFNEYRFPSKIPEFLIAGKPLIMAKTNIGHVLRHKSEAWIMEQGDSIEIAKAIAELHADPALRNRLGENARAWAHAKLSWRLAVAGLEPFYESCRRGSHEAVVAIDRVDDH